MINSTNLYFVFSFLAIVAIFILFANLRQNKTHINNKILLKNLLEGLDVELPEELKRLDNSSTDPQNLS